MKKAKQLFGKIISIMFVLVMILTAIPSETMTVYAEDASLAREVEKAIATNVAKDLYSSNYTDGSELKAGVYYLSNDKTFGSYTSGTNGLKIASRATVYIYIPAGVTLTAYGKDGYKTTGGYAGILVPSGSKLVFLGEGEVKAYGGNAGNGGKGGDGDSYRGAVSGNDMVAPKGGTGGTGGGGAGAGIGTDGGSGGSGAGTGGSKHYPDKDNGNGKTASDDIKGKKGADGSNASAVGEVYNAGVTIYADGGDAGDSGEKGLAGFSNNYTTEDLFDTSSSTLRGMAGGAGGGGGGAGKKGADIGTGGGGGGQGGGGGSAGYIWTGYYIGAGGGGAGAGASYGTGGERSGHKTETTCVDGTTLPQFTKHSNRAMKLEYDASDGSSTSTTPGGGAQGWVSGSQGDSYGTGGSGGSGGSAGVNCSTTGAKTTDFPTFLFTVTFEKAKTTDDLNFQSYNYGETGTIIVPEYDGDASTCFLGWEVKTYGTYVVGEGLLSKDDVTIYQPGETITIDPGFSGSVIFVARTAALQGVSAKTETLVIEAEEMEEVVSYYTYQVKAYLDDVIADVGNLELRDEFGNVYEIAYEDGVYSFITDFDTEFSLYRNNADTGIKVTKNEVAELKLYTASITTKLDGEESAEMGIVSLKGEGAPSLSTLPDSGIYTAIGQLNNVHHNVFVDGIDTGYTVTYGESLELNYYTTTLTLTGHLEPESVVLVANDGSGTIELYKMAEKKYSALKLKHDLTYTLYIDGKMTTFTDVCFDKTNDFSVGYVKTIITTTLDGEAKEVGVVTLDDNQMIKEDDGFYSSKDIIYLDDSTKGTISVNDRVVSTTGLGNGTMVSYYSVEYSSEHKLLGELPTDTTVYLSGDKVLLAPAVTSEDIAYQFAGWYVDDVLYQPGDLVTVTDKKVVVTAAWKDAEFDIYYELGLENAVNAPENPDSYTIGGGNVVIENPTADGYIFDGWTYAGVYEPQKDLIISADARLHYELVANWTPKTYQINSDILDATDNLDGIISLNFGTRITGYADSLVPGAQLVTITNTGNQTIMLNAPVFEGDGANYFVIGALNKTVLEPFESATFVVQPKTELAEGIYKDVIKVSCVSAEASSIEGNSIMLTTQFEVGKDTTAPEVAVTIGNGDKDKTHVSDQFVFEPEETNWYSYSTKPEITINATDLESGVNEIKYYLSKKPLTFAESGGVESISDTAWKTYNPDKKPTITDSSTGAYYLYVKVTDGDGNVSYISTEGLVVDIIAPSISFADGRIPQMNYTYVGTQSIVVTDNHLVSVTLDGEELMLDPDSTFEFNVGPALGTEQMIVAKDSFGHTTEIFFIVDPREYKVQFELNDGTGSMDAWDVYEAETYRLPFLPEDCKAPYGMELAGWAIGSADSDIVIAPGEEYVFEGNTTLHAIWKIATYTIEYELDGGINAEGNPATFDKNTSTITILAPTKEGYFFLGWTWEAGKGIGTEAQTTPVKDVVIAMGSILNKQFIANWEKMTDAIDEIVVNLPSVENVTANDKDSVKDALDIIESLLSDSNVGSLSEEEKATVEEQKAELEELLGQIEEIEEKLASVDSVAKDTPSSSEVTSNHKETIEKTLEAIDNLLEENAGNLTEEEKATLESQKAELRKKLEKIQSVAEQKNAVEEIVNSLPGADEVTSVNKETIKNTLDVVDKLLVGEYAGNLTESEKTAVEDLKAELSERLEKIQTVEDKMASVEETVNSLPEADKVTSDDKGAIEEALDVIEDLLSEENAGNLTATEKSTVESQKTELSEKLEKILAAEEKINEVKETLNELPKADKVTANDKSAIESAIEEIEELLSSEVVENMSDAEKDAFASSKTELIEYLDVIQMIEDTLAELQDEKDSIPSKDVITTESKDEVVELLDILNDLQDNHPNNLTEEQKDVVANLKVELQEKMDRILEIEAALDEIENESVAQPDYKDITSENKEDIKDIIGNIDNVLAEDKDNLSNEEIKQLEEQKKELEDKITFIEKLEKYEPVSDDFENTTKPEINDNSGDLENDSEELIHIIPLEKVEKEHVAKGESIKVYLEVTDITETIDEEEKALIENEIEDKETAVYLDLTLFKQIGDREPKKVPNTNGVVTISFQVPSDLLNKDTYVVRKYQIVRVHEGEVSILDAVFDEATGEISFETDKFSTYALIYEDVEIDVPQTGDTTSSWPWMLLVIGIGLIVLSTKTESMYKSKKR